MIIRFSLENWMSFRNKVTFSMIASKERQHSQRLLQLKKYQTRILPIAAIYGGNASGKTNFFEAIRFVKQFITKGPASPDKLIKLNPFKLDEQMKNQPSRFVFELLIDKFIYEFSFAATRKEVIEEKLVKITNTSERVLYHYGPLKKNINFDPSTYKSEKEHQFLHFAFEGKQKNQLFLTNSVSQNLENFKFLYDWFKDDNLRLIAADSIFPALELLFDQTHPLYNEMNNMLQQLDTGINNLSTEEIPIENLRFPQQFLEDLKDLPEGHAVNIRNIKERFLFIRKNEDLIAKKLIAFHSKPDGTTEKFKISEESDGTQRIMDLLPAFLELFSSKSSKVYIIDELDRSLHTLLTRKLLEYYLSSCSPKTPKQLLFTTHDVLLMDQQLLRRDEMWVAERNSDGESHLISFSEYKDVRYDKNIRKSYLQGRLGGIPRILSKKPFYRPPNTALSMK